MLSNFDDWIEYLLSLYNSFAATSKQIETSSPILKPDFSIASIINSIASSFVFNDGAKPPSSPTVVESFLLFISDFNFWITKKHILIDSENVLGRSGRIINSCILSELLACAPPLIIFIKGNGIWLFVFPPKYLNSEIFFEIAANLQVAMETAKIELAPNLFFCLVPSKSIKALSNFLWSKISKFFKFLDIVPLIFLTEFKTLFPKYSLFSKSLNSKASCFPVDAPDGTIAEAELPSSKKTSASTVGIPLLSKTCRPLILVIFAILYQLINF